MKVELLIMIVVLLAFIAVMLLLMNYPKEGEEIILESHQDLDRWIRNNAADCSQIIILHGKYVMDDNPIYYVRYSR